MVELLNSHGMSFEQLSIQFRSNTQNTPQSFKYLLEKQVPNLKSLQFFGFSYGLWQSDGLFNDSVNLLPNLEYIACIPVTNYRHYWECPLYLNLFSNLTSVKKFTINSSGYWSILIDHALSNKDNNQLAKIFSRLEEINTGFYDNHMLSRLDGHGDILPMRIPKMLILLPELFPKVKILRLCFDCDKISNADVCAVLKMYAEQLEVNVSSYPNYEYENCHKQQAQGVDTSGSLINECLASSIFEKLRIIRTSVDVFQPPSTVTQFSHKQLPALESLTLLYKVENSEYLLAIGRASPNVKTLCINVNGDAALQSIARAFPNLEELTVNCYSGNLEHDGIKCIGDLHRK